MTKHRLLVAQWLATACLLLAACATPTGAEQPDPRPFPATDRIVVSRAPASDFADPNVRTVEIDDAATIDAWRTALATIDTSWDGRARLIKFAGDPPEHWVEFWSGNESLGRRRMKGGLLDTASRGGWSFYSGKVDRVFTGLVLERAPLE